MALTISPQYALQAFHIFCPWTHSETCLLPCQNSLEHFFGFVLLCFVFFQFLSLFVLLLFSYFFFPLKRRSCLQNKFFLLTLTCMLMKYECSDHENKIAWIVLWNHDPLISFRFLVKLTLAWELKFNCQISFLEVGFLYGERLHMQDQVYCL